MKQLIDLSTWNRREHFAFFSAFDEPFHGVVAEVDGARAYAQAKAAGESFFQRYLHAALRAINQLEALRYRIENGQVVCYDQIHASATLLRPDHTFAFSFVPFAEQAADFAPGLQREMAAVEQSSGLRLSPDSARLDVIHFSALPWVQFTSLSHARHFAHPDSVPKISIGRYCRQGEALLLPVSVHVHHGLADGYHVGLFLEAFQQELDRE
ncbi:chloramphenicol acetyltransferase [Hymenobacter busanensis]|uniref:Chloramphenicol acetyltransferase n=1 Tax=Hymenobacter busanensis TaxID=2607656 RepID=A0A7L5A370_9BACT|nr:CatA-like O-acetyltransferase [Hymenobacter busanensis]KAA9327054.1 chloramphenicol acetyltransferase [Hymenobacter busanensis]QHJ09505.1 chloramphenicol acetyltransferase [Hymenobacter busanensis]